MLCVERLVLDHRGLSSNELLVPDEMKDVWSRLQLPHYDKAHDLMVIVDDNFYYASMRKPFFSLAKQYDCGFAIVECHCPLDICLKRNALRLEPVSETTIIQMVGRFESPNEESNHWERYACRVDCSCPLTEAQISLIVEKLILAMSNPFSLAKEKALCEQQLLDRQKNLNSILHVIDNTLRKHIQCLFKSKDDSWKRTCGKLVGRMKADTISDLRSSISSDSRAADSIDFYQKMAVNLFTEKTSHLAT